MKLAISLTRAGIKPGDILLLYIPNCLQTCHTFYVGYITACPILPVDSLTTITELEHYVTLSNPKVIFCVKHNKDNVYKIMESKNITPIVIVLDDTECNIDRFIDQHNENTGYTHFKPPIVDMSAPAWLIPTSGSTGLSKVAVVTHNNTWFNQTFFNFYFETFPKPTKYLFLMSTPQWLTGLSLYCSSALLVFTRIQTTELLTTDLCKTIIERWRPTCTVCSPTKLAELLNGECNLSSFEILVNGGSALNTKVEKTVKTKYPNIRYIAAYGMTELLGICLLPGINGPPLNIGLEMPFGFKYRIVDVVTGDLITKPNVSGEFLVKPNSVFGGYYNNSEESINIFDNDGYLRTGDIVYKDEEGYYYFVERLKMLLKYKGYHVYPTEIEAVLRRHPAVADAAVTGVRDDECGDLPVGVVIVKEGYKVTAKELRDLVAEQLSDSKQLRGGVVFVDKFPLTPSHKLNRVKLRDVLRDAVIEF